MNKIADFFIKVWPVVKGRPYVRIATLMVSLGAGLAAGPSFWEMVLSLVITLLGIVYDGSPSFPVISDGGLFSQVFGVLLCIAGVFLFWYYSRHEANKLDAELHDRTAWLWLQILWKSQRDIYPKLNANAEDVLEALLAVNETGRILAKSPALLECFRSQRGQDYLTLFLKLRDEAYVVPGERRTTDQLLDEEASVLFTQLNGEG
ncbi:MAG: hypothetical protein R3F18_17150 [Lysobacterales bacterium]|nr:hypothetical protein [Xanthomonadales bacterium]